MTGAGWVRAYQDGADYLESRGNVLWADAPVPCRWHRCRAQTRGQFGKSYAERCACGASRVAPGGPWAEKNERRHARARRARGAGAGHRSL